MAVLSKFLSLCCLCLLLAACAAPHAANSSYTSPSTGVVTPIETNRESCLRRCNGEFDRCGDQESTRRTADPFPRELFGAAADCRSRLVECTRRCKTI
jgi:hypothetical protein